MVNVCLVVGLFNFLANGFFVPFAIQMNVELQSKRNSPFK